MKNLNQIKYGIGTNSILFLLVERQVFNFKEKYLKIRVSNDEGLILKFSQSFMPCPYYSSRMSQVTPFILEFHFF